MSFQLRLNVDYFFKLNIILVNTNLLVDKNNKSYIIVILIDIANMFGELIITIMIFS